MAAHERLSFTSIAPNTLTEQLAKVLPKAAALKLYHVSSPPSKTSALYSAPPGERPDRTYCESHFLAASVNSNSGAATNKTRDVLAFAIEVLIYSTAYATTLFVSKADSTGYLHLLNLPKGSPSPLKEISSTFLAYLVERRKRPGIPSIVSLFARAQDQYLFPGSVENAGKHVLDDRGLVRWWCRVLDPLIGKSNDSVFDNDGQWDSVHGYLTIPGLDKYETISFVPRSVGSSEERWLVGNPLQDLSRHQMDIPPRCLIPHFPDDPKARYLDELDEELSTSQNKSSSGDWKSVKSLDQFWEMMAFRQECSAGRMVGFIWVVFTPTSSTKQTEPAKEESQNTVAGSNTAGVEDADAPLDLSSLPTPGTPNKSFNASSQVPPIASPAKKAGLASSQIQDPTPNQVFLSATKNKAKKLSGLIKPRQPRVKTKHRLYSLNRPESTPYYVWPSHSRGQVVLDEKDYKRVTELLQRLDFETLDLAVGSTRRWVAEVRSGATSNTGIWGEAVTGTKAFEAKSGTVKTGATTLNVGLVRKKRKEGADEADEAGNNNSITTSTEAPQVNVLGAGMVRKKVKV